MIDIVTDVLQHEGLLTDFSNTSVNMISGGAINFQVFSGQSNKFWNVKVARTDLQREYHALQRAMSIIPDAVPIPLSLRRRDGLDLLVTGGIAVQAVRRMSKEFIAFLTRYLETTTMGFREADAVTHRRFLSDICGSGCLDEWSGELGSWLASSQSGFIDDLPLVAQHGDFCLHNLGVSHGHYIIFDWEDFGRVWLPGFDLIVFVVSFLGLKATTINDVLSGGGSDEHGVYCCV
jgi:Phosphotransferase enzyme family